MLGLPLNIATILSCIFSILFSDFKERGRRGIHKPPMTALTVFFYAYAEINVHPLPELWYFIFNSLWWYACSCMDNMPMLWSASDVIISGSWSIIFKVLTLSVAICMVLLHFSNICLGLSNVACFSKTGTKVLISSKCFSCLPAWSGMRFGVMFFESHGYFSMATF